MSKRAVLYARVSGDDSKNESRNLNAQLAMCREYAAAHGYEIIAELGEDDRGASGAAFELPQLTRVREMARAGDIDVVVTRDLDRFSRGLAKQLFVEYELTRSGVEIEYVLAQYDDSAEGGLIKNVRASIAEFERLKIAERTTRGRRLKVASGSVIVFSRPPYGYQSARDERGRTTFAIDEDEAEVVAQVFTWYAEGASLGDLQRRLEERHVLTSWDKRTPAGVSKRRAPGRWAIGTLADMLANETYRGVWRYGKVTTIGKRRRTAPEEQITVAVPRIVSDELWEAAQRRRKTNQENARRRTRYPYLIRRRARCGLCNRKLKCESVTSPWGKTYLYYRCPASAKGRYAGDCSLPTFTAGEADDLIWNWVQHLILYPAALEKGLRELQVQRSAAAAPLLSRLERVDREIARLNDELAATARLYVKKRIDEAVLDKLSDELNAELAGRRDERARAQRELATGQLLTESTIAGILAFARGLAEDLATVENDFEMRRWIIESFDVEAVLWVEDGEKHVRASLVFPNGALPIGSSITDDDRGKSLSGVVLSEVLS